MPGLLTLGVDAAAAGAAPFDPSSLSGLKAWFKADGTLWQDSARTTAAAANADPVGSWDDASGGGFHAQQATGTKRPTLRTAVQNGMPVVRFDGVDDLLDSLVGAVAQPTTLFFVATIANPGSSSYLTDSTATTRHLVNMASPTTWQTYAGGSLIASSAFTPSAWHVYCAQFNGASSLGRLDGTQVLSGSAGTQGMTNFRLGASTVPNAWLQGDMGEVLAYAALLTTGQMQSVEGYLKTRWGTP